MTETKAEQLSLPIVERSPRAKRKPPAAPLEPSRIGKWSLFTGDCIEVMRDMEPESFHTCVTSPPYWGLRNYGVDGQLGLEKTPREYVENLVAVFREVRRVLRADGTLWLVIGDSYAPRSSASPQRNLKALAERMDPRARPRKTHRDADGLVPRPERERAPGVKAKDLLGIPWRVAFALQADGWYLRSDIVWHKPNPMPESVADRPTKSHEYVFLLAKSERYFYDSKAIEEPAAFPQGAGNKRGYEVPGQREGRNANLGGNLHRIGPRKTRNRRSVWTVTTKPFKGAHFATFPPDLIEPCILAGAPFGGRVLDIFSGAATTGLVAVRHGRDYAGIDISAEYTAMGAARIRADIKHRTGGA